MIIKKVLMLFFGIVSSITTFCLIPFKKIKLFEDFNFFKKESHVFFDGNKAIEQLIENSKNIEPTKIGSIENLNSDFLKLKQLVESETAKLAEKSLFLDKKLEIINGQGRTNIQLESSNKTLLWVSIFCSICSIYLFLKYKKLQKRLKINLILMRQQLNNTINLQTGLENINKDFIETNVNSINDYVNNLNTKSDKLDEWSHHCKNKNSHVLEQLAIANEKNKRIIEHITTVNIHALYKLLMKDITNRGSLNSKTLYERVFNTNKNYSNDAIRLAYGFSFLITSNYVLGLGLNEINLNSFHQVIANQSFPSLNSHKTLIGLEDVFIVDSHNQPINLQFNNIDHLPVEKKAVIKKAMFKLR